MADITFNEIKTNMEFIVREFAKALNNRDYDAARQISSQIFELYESTHKIELDTNSEYDHVFHEVTAKMDEEIKRASSTPVTEAEAKKLVKFQREFYEMADKTFKVAEARKRVLELDPTAEDLIAGYQEGINEAKKHKEGLKRQQKMYQGINEEILGKGTPNLKDKIDTEKFEIGRLDSISQLVNELNGYQGAIDTMEAEIASNPAREAQLRPVINKNKAMIQNGISTMSSMITELEGMGVDVTEIKKAADENNAVRMSAVPHVDSAKATYETEMIANYRTLLANLQSVKGKHSDLQVFEGMDLNSLDVNKPEDRAKIDAALNKVLSISDAIRDAIDLQDKYIEVYTRSIEEVREEQKILGIDTSDRSRYTGAIEADDEAKRSLQDELDYYRQDEDDKMYGNPEKAEKYKKYIKLFKSCVVTKNMELRDFNGEVMLDDEGNVRTGTYQTVDYSALEAKLAADFPGESVENCIKFLQLEEYKDRLERTSKIRSGDKFAYTTLPSYEKLRTATTDEEKAAATEAIRTELAEDQLYIRTNHQASNTHEFMADAIGNAGSLVAFKNGVKHPSDYKGIGKVGAVAYNYASWIGLRNPAGGKGALGKVGRTLWDGFLIGTSPAIVATKALYRYTPVVGKEAQKKRYIKRYQGEDSSPYDGLAMSRKMKRREAYKSEMGGILKGARAFIKATNDDVFRKDRAEETEKKITDKHFEEEVEPTVRERYIRGARRQDEEKQAQARENMQTRIAATHEVAGRAYAYNDMSADPMKADEAYLGSRAIQGSALELNGMDSSKLQYNDTMRPRDRRHEKPNGEIGELHRGLKGDEVDFSKPEGAVANTDAIGRQTRKKAIVARKTATNFIPYVLTGVAVGGAARYTLSKIKIGSHQVQTGSHQEQTGSHLEQTGSHLKQTGSHTEYKTVSDPTSATTQVDYTNAATTPSDFTKVFDNSSVDVRRSVWGGERGGWGAADVSDLDSVAGFYVEYGGEKVAIASCEGGDVYSYLGTLAKDLGLPQSELSKYIDLTTGEFLPDANLYDLAAKVITNRPNGISISGDDLLKAVVENSDAKSYVELVREGTKYGGWIDATSGEAIPTTIIEGTKTIPVEVPEYTLVPDYTSVPDYTTVADYTTVVDYVPDSVARAVGAGVVASDVVEAVGNHGKYVKDKTRREPGPDKADKNEPRRSKQARGEREIGD